jgi:hypothetical protein
MQDVIENIAENNGVTSVPGRVEMMKLLTDSSVGLWLDEPSTGYHGSTEEPFFDEISCEAMCLVCVYSIGLSLEVENH